MTGHDMKFIAEKITGAIGGPADTVQRILEALDLAEATINRLKVQHGRFSSVDGTLSVIADAKAKAYQVFTCPCDQCAALREKEGR